MYFIISDVFENNHTDFSFFLRNTAFFSRSNNLENIAEKTKAFAQVLDYVGE